jgi:hypothetical protein
MSTRSIHVQEVGWISNNYKYLCNIFRDGKYCKHRRADDPLLFLRKPIPYHVASNFTVKTNKIRSHYYLRIVEFCGKNSFRWLGSEPFPFRGRMFPFPTNALDSYLI